MAEKFTIEPAHGTIVVRTGDAVIAESQAALVLREDGHAPVFYLPRDDVAMEFLDRSTKVTHCPHKGDAAHYHVISPAARLEDAAWSYEDPKPGADAIRGHLAFYPAHLAIERL